MAKSYILNLDFLVEGGSGGETLHNSNINILEAFAMLSVINLDQATEPGSPSDGDRYEVASAGTTGAFVGHENELALYFGGWIFYTIVEGMRIYNLAENKFYLHDGSSLTQRPFLDGSISDLNQNISPTPTISEVQDISDKIDEILAKLRTTNLLNT